MPRKSPTSQSPRPEFDVNHIHFDRFHFAVLSRYANCTLTTQHGRQDLTELQQLYAAFP